MILAKKSESVDITARVCDEFTTLFRIKLQFHYEILESVIIQIKTIENSL